MILVVTASETGRAHHVNLHICFFTVCRIVVWKSNVAAGVGQSLLEKSSWEGDTPILVYSSCAIIHAFWELSCLGLQLEVGGKFHLRLNICGSPIEHKYREGKMQRTLKRELKSTWNCWKGSEGNQCQRSVIFLLLLVVGALWRGMGQHRLFLGQTFGW